MAKAIKVTDHLEIKHKSLCECAKFYNIKPYILYSRMNASYFTLRESLVTPIYDNSRIPPEVNDNSLNPLIMIHEYSHTQDWTGRRVFRCTEIKTNETAYMTEDQISAYK